MSAPPTRSLTGQSAIEEAGGNKAGTLPFSFGGAENASTVTGNGRSTALPSVASSAVSSRRPSVSGSGAAPPNEEQKSQGRHLLNQATRTAVKRNLNQFHRNQEGRQAQIAELLKGAYKGALSGAPKGTPNAAFLQKAVDYRDNQGLSLGDPEILDKVMAASNQRSLDLMGSPLIKEMVRVCVGAVRSRESLAEVVGYVGPKVAGKRNLEEDCQMVGFELNDHIRRDIQTLLAVSKERGSAAAANSRRRRPRRRYGISLRRIKQRGGARWNSGERRCFIVYVLISILLGLLAAHTGTFAAKGLPVAIEELKGVGRSLGSAPIDVAAATVRGAHGAGLEGLKRLYDFASEGVLAWKNILTFSSETYIPKEVADSIAGTLSTFSKLGTTKEYNHYRKQVSLRDGIAYQYAETTDTLAEGVLLLKTDPRYSARTSKMVGMLRETVLPALEASATNRTTLCSSVEETVLKLSDVKEPDGSLTAESVVIGDWYAKGCTGPFNVSFGDLIDNMPLDAEEFTREELVEVTTVVQQLHNNTNRDAAYSNMTEIVEEALRLYGDEKGEGIPQPNELTRAAVSLLIEGVMNISGFPLVSQFIEPELHAALFGPGEAAVDPTGLVQIGMTTRSDDESIKYFAYPIVESAPLVSPTLVETPPLTIDEETQRLVFDPLYTSIDPTVSVPDELRGVVHALFANRVLQHEIENRELVVASARSRSEESLKGLKFKIYNTLTIRVRAYAESNIPDDPRKEELIVATQPYIQLFETLRIVPPEGIEETLIGYARTATTGSHEKVRAEVVIGNLVPRVSALPVYRQPGEEVAEEPLLVSAGGIVGVAGGIGEFLLFAWSIVNGSIQGGYSTLGVFAGLLASLVTIKGSYDTVEKDAAAREQKEQLDTALRRINQVVKAIPIGASGVPQLTNATAPGVPLLENAAAAAQPRRAPRAASPSVRGTAARANDAAPVPATLAGSAGVAAVLAGSAGVAPVPAPPQYPPLVLPPPPPAFPSYGAYPPAAFPSYGAYPHPAYPPAAAPSYGAYPPVPPAYLSTASTGGGGARGGTRPPFSRLSGESNVAFLKRLIAYNKTSANPYPPSYGIAVVRGIRFTDPEMDTLNHDVQDPTDRATLKRWFTGAGTGAQATAAGFRRATRKRKNRRL